MLNKADLEGADLGGAFLSATVFAACSGLHRARGLGEVRPAGPSSIDVATLRAGYLPEPFLELLGLEPAEIALLARLSAS